MFEKLLDKLNIGEKVELIAADGTGFGYGEQIKLNWMRGAQSILTNEMIAGKVKDRAIIRGIRKRAKREYEAKRDEIIGRGTS